ncbi:ABC transporter ATP-binding protein [Paenibacillus turpanensis]|uniref:ABC transporter ATP-binding protein n=1 Tax=Paenibacillus turpanensis TaxID=2689078 RepID=UPI001407304C|nr:ABC transporter ATP-binding protein [Paenibacillus turpanensis]
MNIMEITDLGKKYKIYNKKYSRIIEWLTGSNIHDEKWVLKGINFKVRAGESIGIVGHNGAGKSTLLKIITGTTKASKGTVKINGRITALLELGMGFHPDFTGIENVYMTGQLMGLSNQEISEVIPSIINFAEIGDYFYQPLRTYSSGMNVRLGFSIATAVRPDILIVDEALSVGDAYFQHKCFEKIKEFKELGTTIFFVSHDPGAVKNLCDRAILLDSGQLIREGTPVEILDYYNAIIAKRQADYEIKQTSGEGKKFVTRSGNKEVQIKSVNLNANAIQVGDLLEIKVDIECLKGSVENPTIGFVIKDRLGNEIFGTNTYYLNYNLGKIEENVSKCVVFKLPANFGVGNYSVTVAVHDSFSHVSRNYDWWDQVETFQVIPGDEPHFVGVAFTQTSVTTTTTNKFPVLKEGLE